MRNDMVQALRDRVIAVLQEGPLARRTVAYRANCGEAAVNTLIKTGALEIVGREPIPRFAPKCIKGHPIVAIRKAA